MKMQFVCVVRIKNDDKMIQAEGVESLSEAELRQACRERGKLGLLSVEEMRQQVQLNFKSIPPMDNFPLIQKYIYFKE